MKKKQNLRDESLYNKIRETKFQNFEPRIWLIRAGIVLVNIILLARLIGTLKVEAVTNHQYSNIGSWLSFLPGIAGFLITFIPHKSMQLVAVLLTVTEIVLFILFWLGVLKLFN